MADRPIAPQPDSEPPISQPDTIPDAESQPGDAQPPAEHSSPEVAKPEKPNGEEQPVQSSGLSTDQWITLVSSLAPARSRGLSTDQWITLVASLAAVFALIFSIYQNSVSDGRFYEAQRRSDSLERESNKEAVRISIRDSIQTNTLVLEYKNNRYSDSAQLAFLGNQLSLLNQSLLLQGQALDVQRTSNLSELSVVTRSEQEFEYRRDKSKTFFSPTHYVVNLGKSPAKNINMDAEIIEKKCWEECHYQIVPYYDINKYHADYLNPGDSIKFASEDNYILPYKIDSLQESKIRTIKDSLFNLIVDTNKQFVTNLEEIIKLLKVYGLLESYDIYQKAKLEKAIESLKKSDPSKFISLEKRINLLFEDHNKIAIRQQAALTENSRIMKRYPENPIKHFLLIRISGEDNYQKEAKITYYISQIVPTRSYSYEEKAYVVSFALQPIALDDLQSIKNVITQRGFDYNAIYQSAKKRLIPTRNRDVDI